MRSERRRPSSRSQSLPGPDAHRIDGACEERQPSPTECVAAYVSIDARAVRLKARWHPRRYEHPGRRVSSERPKSTWHARNALTCKKTVCISGAKRFLQFPRLFCELFGLFGERRSDRLVLAEDFLILSLDRVDLLGLLCIRECEQAQHPYHHCESS